MAKKNTGKEYEKLIRDIYQVLLDYESADTSYRKIDVQHDILIKGRSGTTHQIDVYWEFFLADTKYITIIQAKDWQSKVKKEHISSFKGIMDDIAGCSKGIFVAKNGFQSGAIEYARCYGIELIQIKEKERQSYNVLWEHIVTHYSCCNVHIDETWLGKNIEYESFLDHFIPEKDYDEVCILSPLNERLVLMDMLCKDALPYYYAPAGEIHKINKELSGTWFWLTDNQTVPYVKITGYDFVCVNTVYYDEFSITNLFDYIVIQISTGKKKLYSSTRKTIKNINETEVIV